MKLEPITGSTWESWTIAGTPFGIEKIDHNAYFNFRLFGTRRVYLDKETSYSTRRKAYDVLRGHAARYEKNIVTASA